MADITTPALGESVTEATVASWKKKPGDAVKRDEILVELETDKVSLEVASPSDGVLESIAAADGETVVPGALLGVVTAGGAAAAPKAEPAKAEAPKTEAPKAEPAAAVAGEAQPE
ncbi:MAG: dihydrolipoamide succinyltransferase, partial [Caulobacteraceae bacterium]